MALTQVTSDGIKAGAVTTNDISDSSISTAKIADDAVTADKLANTSVTAGSYTVSSITVDAQGRITAASSGTAADTDKIEEGNTNVECVDTGSDGHITFDTEGSERMRIDSSGNVGIGTASPGDKLAVSDGSNITELSGYSLYFKSDSTGYIQSGPSGGSSGRLVFQTNATERMRIDSSGRLLLGTTTEGQANADNLTINDSGNCGLTIRSGTDNAGSIYFSDATSGGGEYEGYIVYSQPNGFMQFGTGQVERMRIDSSGRVGIGTTSPGQLLEINGASNPCVLIKDTTNDVIAYTFADNSVANFGSASNHPVVFRVNNVEQMRLDSSGRLLLQTTDSTGTQLLKVNGDTSLTTNGGRIALTQGRTTPANGATHGVLSFGTETRPAQVELIGFVDGTWTDGQYHPSGLLIKCTAYNRSDTMERVRITDTGEFNAYGDGSIFQAGTLQGSGTNVYFYEGRRNQNTGGTRTYIVYSNGNVQNTNNSYGSLSDQRLKENIVDATSQWNDIKSLQIRKYNFREATGHETHTQIGLIAQEAESVSPGLVQTTAVAEGETVQDADGNQLESLKSINYSVLYMKAVKALQEAMARIETLETKVAALETAE